MRFLRKKTRNEEAERTAIALLLEQERTHIEAAMHYQDQRNELFKSNGIPAPHPPLCKGCLARGKRNTQALAEIIAYQEGGIEKVQSWLADTNADRLIERLESREHTYRTSEKEGEPQDARLLGPLQRVRAYCLLDQLEDSRLVAEITEILERNPRDGQTELGGFIIPDSVRMRAALYEGGTNGSGMRSFGWSAKDLSLTPHIALFHLHAITDDCTKYAGPSYGGCESDMSTSQGTAWHTGESHDIVITRLPQKRFNIDYYTTQRRMVQGRLTEEIGCVDLGNYPVQ